MNSIAGCIRNPLEKTTLSKFAAYMMTRRLSNSMSGRDANWIADLYRPHVIDGIKIIGDRFGMFTLTAGVYGLKTKLKLAIESGMLNETIGIDLVATCVNDLVATGAVPSLFSDYFSTAELDVDHAEKVIRGMDTACCQCDTTFLNKEEAAKISGSSIDEPILGGIVYGHVEKNSVINGKNIEIGDVLIGLPSSGLHSYGFSLVRRVLERSGSSLMDNLPGTNITLGESLMSPTVIYVKQVLDIITKTKGNVKGIAQIKYGGLIKNIALPIGLGAVIFNDSWMVHPIFKWIQEAGRIEEVEMRETFNMGIGMVLVVSKESAIRILGEASGENIAYRIGEVVSGNGLKYK